MTEQRRSITAKVHILGIFYKGEEQPLVFSIEVDGDAGNIQYAEIPARDAEFRAMAKEAGQLLEKWVLDWNDSEIERAQTYIDELSKRGLAFTVTGTLIDSVWSALQRNPEVDK